MQVAGLSQNPHFAFSGGMVLDEIDTCITFSMPKLLYTLYDEVHVNTVSKVYLHKLQRKYSYGPFYDKYFSGCRLP